MAASRCAAEVVQSGTGIVHAHRLLIPNKCLIDDTEAVCTRYAKVFKGSSKGGMVVVQKLVVRCSLMGDHIVRRRSLEKGLLFMQFGAWRASVTLFPCLVKIPRALFFTRNCLDGNFISF